jgi:hypothetical protein
MAIVKIAISSRNPPEKHIEGIIRIRMSAVNRFRHLFSECLQNPMGNIRILRHVRGETAGKSVQRRTELDDLSLQLNRYCR